MKVHKPNLPKTIGVWTRPDSPRIINSRNIFEYMNGAGELYLAYRFNHLEVYEYKADDAKSILVELYYMETSDDAFGLLSLDWGGEHVSFSDSPANTSNQSLTSSARALYGAGLLRIWSNNLYCRVMAFRETPASKQAVLSLGKTIAANRKSPPGPELLKILPLDIGMGWKLRNDRIGYFRSHLVLNSLYYLSHQNILNLDLSTEAIAAPYDSIDGKDRKRVQFLFVRYEDSGQAQQALDNFHKAYLPEHEKDFALGSVTKSQSFFKIEDGWLGYKVYGPCIALVFECPDENSARMIIEQIQFNLLKTGG
ncbi:MAG: hypothetical protein JSV14_13125 [Deltaproteobacteria bacterium]|nr:MAG: hypothetical protein JSV14_13125 [Deltaproteobacteria bacterium]